MLDFPGDTSSLWTPSSSLTEFQTFYPRSLLDAPDIEIENADGLRHKVRKRILYEFAKEFNLVAIPSTANSLYLDTQKLTLYTQLGLTLRDRKGGFSHCGGESYDNQFALKFRHTALQALSDEITQFFYPSASTNCNAPYIRAEIERSHTEPTTSSELRYFDLPKAIRFHLAQKFGELGLDRHNLVNMVLKPQFVTCVERNKYSIYFDPTKPLDDDLNRPLRAASEHMLVTGKWMCLEIGDDPICDYRLPPPGMPIHEILEADKRDFRRFKRLSLRENILEREVKPHLCGPALTDIEMVGGYIAFTNWLYSIGEKMQSKKVNRGSAKDPVRPVYSKATGGMDALSLRHGVLRSAFLAAQSTAP